MRVLIINNFFSPVGGAEKIAYDTYKLLEKNGHEVFFWATDLKPYFEPDYKYQNYFYHYDHSILNYIKHPINYYYNNKSQGMLKKYIEEIKPDVIHLHGINFFTYSILECCKNIPNVMTVHDSYIVCPTSKLFKNGKICQNYSCQHGNYVHCLLNNCYSKNLEYQFRNILRSKIGKKNLKYINKFITPSIALKNLILKSNIGIKEDRIISINNFLSDEELHTIPRYENDGYFLYVGRLSKEKGIHYLLEAMKDLPKDIELHIVGRGSDEEKLKQYVKENGLDNIKFLGFKNREEIKEEYQNCIATILPCNWFENFPTTNMESFINGKPVIASNIGGIPEQVEHNRTGLLFEPANVEQLKGGILKYWNNRDLVIANGKQAYEKAKTLYTEERYYQELMQIYKCTIK